MNVFIESRKYASVSYHLPIAQLIWRSLYEFKPGSQKAAMICAADSFYNRAVAFSNLGSLASMTASFSTCFFLAVFFACLWLLSLFFISLHELSSHFAISWQHSCLVLKLCVIQCHGSFHCAFGQCWPITFKLLNKLLWTVIVNFTSGKFLQISIFWSANKDLYFCTRGRLFASAFKI